MHSILFLLATLIHLGTQTVDVEIANTPETRARGLMWRVTLPEGRGMLFVYDKPQILGFWMKNTFIPLSIGFFDENQTLISVSEMEAHKGRAQSPKPAVYALEMPRGWFQKHAIRPGEKFSFLNQ